MTPAAAVWKQLKGDTNGMLYLCLKLLTHADGEVAEKETKKARDSISTWSCWQEMGDEKRHRMVESVSELLYGPLSNRRARQEAMRFCCYLFQKNDTLTDPMDLLKDLCSVVGADGKSNTLELELVGEATMGLGGFFRPHFEDVVNS